MHHVYILRCASGELYVGITSDLESRLARHTNGTACRFTATRRPVDLVYSEIVDTAAAAMSRERQIKRWTRAKKEALIQCDSAGLRVLSRRRVF
jgi:putative endonuclease